MKKLLATTALLVALAVPALAFDSKEKGMSSTWNGSCTLAIKGIEDPYCLTRLRLWRSYDKQRYSFGTSFKMSEKAEASTFEFVGAHPFYTPKGEPDIFMIEELWITKTIDGKEKILREKASGKCTAFVEDSKLYLDCKIKGKSAPAIAFTFIGEQEDSKKEDTEGDNKQNERGA